MDSTTTVPLSIRIDSKVKQMLDEVAKSDNISTSALTTELIEKYLISRKNKHVAINAALIEADEWKFISHEKMRTWFASLGWNNEIPFPDPDIVTNLK